MFTIETDQLKISIVAKGAEVKTVFHKGNGLNYMWRGDPAYWAKTSPVLFPIVGTLKNNTFFYEDKAYHLSRHGFARDKEFIVTEQTENSITLAIESSPETLVVYPFSFVFSIRYAVVKNTLSVNYFVRNSGDREMLFSVGGHPAFKLPLVEGTAYDDYQLTFEKTETAGRWPISEEGLIEEMPQPFLDETNTLPLSKYLFSKDAIVVKNLQSRSVQLHSDKSTHGLRFSFDDFPYLGLWAAPGADFLCIEPWLGIADSVDSDQQLAHKEGIIKMPPQGTFTATWQVAFF